MDERTLDYGVQKTAALGPWRRVVFIAVAASIALVVIPKCAFWIARSDWFAECTTPTLDHLLSNNARMSLPSSFGSDARDIRGGSSIIGFFRGHMAPQDASAFAATLRHDPNYQMQIMLAPPAWWSSPTWADRQTFASYSSDEFFILHISPSTGTIEVEWIDPWLDD